jgi:hypothetical protein
MKHHSFQEKISPAKKTVIRVMHSFCYLVPLAVLRVARTGRTLTGSSFRSIPPLAFALQPTCRPPLPIPIAAATLPSLAAPPCCLPISKRSTPLSPAATCSCASFTPGMAGAVGGPAWSRPSHSTAAAAAAAGHPAAAMACSSGPTSAPPSPVRTTSAGGGCTHPIRVGRGAGAQGALGVEKLRPWRGRGAQQKSWGRTFAKLTLNEGSNKSIQ